MRVVITGATGFIGSNLARVFLEQGAHVYALVRPGSLHLDALPVHERLHTVACDLAHVLECVPEVGHADGFFHMAWGGVNREEIDSPEVQARNVAGSLDCVEAAGRLGCRVFMDAGSRVEYGAVDGIMEEEAPCRPINEYGKAKWEFYQKAAPLCSRLGLHYYHLRFFSVYGCGDHPWSIISTLVRDLRQDKKVSLSACRHMWNFMYIEDAVQAVYELYRQAVNEEPGLKKDNFRSPISAIVNIASQDTRPLRSFVEEIHDIVGFKGTLEYGTFVQAKEGALSIRPDITRLKRLTGGRWQERYTFRGIKTSSKENRLMYWLRSCYYKTIKKLSDVEQIEHFTGSGLYDREFIEVLRNLDDPTPFLRGIVAELGYRRKEIPYEQPRRRAGKTHNNFYRLYDAAMLSVTSYTKAGLRLATIFGSICAVVSMLIAMVYLVMKLIWWDRFPAGMAPMLIGMLFLGSVQLFFIGFLGEYIMSINQRVMKRPLVIEEERINFNEEEKKGGNEA